MGLLNFDADSLSQNALLQAGLGILANNQGHGGQFAPAFGQGTMQGLQQANEYKRKQQEALLRQQQMDMQQAQFVQQQQAYQRALDAQNKRDAAMPRLLAGDASYKSMQNTPVISTQNMPNPIQEGAQSPDFGTTQQSITTMQQTPYIDNAKRMQDYVDAGLGDEILKAQLSPKEHNFDIAPDGTMYDKKSGNTLPGNKFAKPEVIDYNKAFLPGGAPNKAFQDYSLLHAKSGAANVSVNNKLDLKTGEGLAKEVGPMLSASKAAAEGANQTFDIANRIDSAIKSNKLIAGPLANQRVQLLQFGQTLGINGANDTETLANTRGAIQGLAQFTLAGRSSLKGQGQISDYEGKLLARATSGDITDLTIPELKVISDAAKRVAKVQQDTHSRNMKVMRSKPELADVADFYDVPTNETNQPSVEDTSSQPKSVIVPINGKKMPLKLGEDGLYYDAQGNGYKKKAQ